MSVTELVLTIVAALVVLGLQIWLVPIFRGWSIRHGARDPQWLTINDEPPGFKAQRQRELEGKKP